MPESIAVAYTTFKILGQIQGLWQQILSEKLFFTT